MRTTSSEIRCRRCGTLLAKTDDAGMTIDRGQLQATMMGDFSASFVCYMPRCRALTVVKVNATPSGQGR